jgi:hypothetical protein
MSAMSTLNAQLVSTMIAARLRGILHPLYDRLTEMHARCSDILQTALQRHAH